MNCISPSCFGVPSVSEVRVILNMESVDSLERITRPLHHEDATSFQHDRTNVNNRKDDPVNPYCVLQIRTDSSTSEIREAYRRLALWHHPGRATHVTKEETERRSEIFKILSACYETCMDSEIRQRHDQLLHDEEISAGTNGLLKGEFHIGGKKVEHNVNFISTPERFKAQPQQSLWWNACSDQPSANHVSQEERVLPPLLSIGRSSSSSSSTSSSEDDDSQIHYSTDETNRLFGGPLSRMYKARAFEPFTEPIDVFRKVFGSAIFRLEPQRSPPKQLTIAISSPDQSIQDSPCNNTITSNNTIASSSPIQSPRSAAWMGSTSTKQDGTIVSTTTRTLFDRKMTRTETITIDPITKQRHISVTVQSEPAIDDGVGVAILEEQPDWCPEFSNCCGSPNASDDKKKGTSAAGASILDTEFDEEGEDEDEKEEEADQPQVADLEKSNGKIICCSSFKDLLCGSLIPE